MDKFERDREVLMKKLLDSVKQCQVDFGGRTVLASEKDSSVSCLVAQFEQAFQHGLKKNKMWERISSFVEPVRQITEKMLFEIDLTFWSVVKEHLGPSELNHFNSLEDITTDSGKARVWLRTAINENSLERQLLIILGNVPLLRLFYEPWALFLDVERSSTMPAMARGLGSILFAIKVKNPSLNQPFKQIPVPNGISKNDLAQNKTHRRVNSTPLLQQCIAEPSIMKKINMKKKKKKRVVSAVINDLDDGSNVPSNVDNTLSSYIRANIMNKSASTSQVQVSTVHRTNSDPVSQGSYCSGGSKDAPSFSFEKSLGGNLERSTSENLVQGMIVTDCEKTVFPLIQERDCDEVFESAQQTKTEEMSFSDKLYMIKALYSDNSVEHNVDKALNSNRSVEHNLDKALYSDSTVEHNLDKVIVKKVSEQSEKVVTKIKENDIKLKIDYSELVLKDSFVIVGNDGDELAENDIFQNKSTEQNQVYFNQNKCFNKNDIEEDKADKVTEMAGDFLYHPLSDLHSTSDNPTDKSLHGPLAEKNDNLVENNTINSSSECLELFLSYDSESTQAASDMLTLLTSTSVNEMFPIDQMPQEEVQQACNFEEILASKSLDLQAASGSLSVADLKQAILTTVKKKDDVELKNKDLQTALEEEQKLNICLKNDLEAASNRILVIEDTMGKKLAEISHENEVLKNQLKKYVAAVRLLKKENGNINDFIDADDFVTIPASNQNHDSYEEKLIQMAEMHGELMELQEHLQRQLISQDNYIIRMKQELISLRGPLPNDLISSTSSFPLTKSSFSQNRLVSIWVPSVFLKGKGAEAHHLYQIYIRVGDEEWNIYRRYSQFNKLRSQVSKMSLMLEKFDFPKKKMFGKKDLKFVEERRLRLQEYLRTVINACIAGNLSIDTCKQDLIKHMPFFGEAFCEDDTKSKKLKNSKPLTNSSGL